MSQVIYPVDTTISFFVVNIIVLAVILLANRFSHLKNYFSPSKEMHVETVSNPGAAATGLNTGDVLGWEFEYARITASEAMRDRHTMINYYLVVTTIVASGVAVVLKADSSGTSVPDVVGTILLWTLCIVGWFYFLKIIRLREAWYESARAMNKIKDFYLRSVDAELSSAFLWKTETLPTPQKAWSVYFYSAMLIGFLDSMALVLGGVLLFGIDNINVELMQRNLPLLASLGLIFLLYHWVLYFLFLKPLPPRNRG